jgi:hypothetical protein
VDSKAVEAPTERVTHSVVSEWRGVGEWHSCEAGSERSSERTLAHATYDPPVPRAGLLHAVGGSRRCGVVIALESGRGFLGGEYGWPGEPDAFAKLRDVLEAED